MARGEQADADRDHHAAGDRPPSTAGHERAADQSHALAENDAADDDQQKTETAGYAAEHQHHVSSDQLDQPLVADPEVMRDLVEHDVPDLEA